MDRIQVLERLALMGPNIYSHRPCIKWKIDLGGYEQRPTNLLPGFSEGLKHALPTMIEHRCSEGERGGFFSRVDEGTWLGHVMEHVALELQSLVGIDVGFGRTRTANRDGIYNVVYACDERETGIFAGEIALEFIQALAEQQPYPLDEMIARLRDTHDRHALGPSTSSIVAAARKRGIPHMRLDDLNLVQFGYGARQKKIQATIASTTSYLGVGAAGDKDLTKTLLGFHGVPVPKGGTTRTVEGALRIANEVGWPVVVKPLDASQGRGIVTNVHDEAELRIAFEEAKRYRATVVVERHLLGTDFRLLVINGKLVAAAQRIPAHVVGDGVHTIAQLVELENADPRRGESHENVLTKIKIDDATRNLLSLRGLTVDSVPAPGETVFLKTTANLSTGGTAIDVTDRVHPTNVELAERIACLVDLDIAGVDVVAPSIETPVEQNGGGVVEVNAAPGFRMHLAPTSGKARPVGEAVIDMLFPPGSESRIPIITITGTNGKTTTSRLCAHIARLAGKCVGLTTSDGIYIRGRLVQKGDTTGPASAAVVLRDPSVTFAVLETARGGILRAGLGYDWSNAAVLTNVAADHLGIRDIETIEDLADVKSVTLERVLPEGYAILNAEDGMTPYLRSRIESKLAVFALDPHNEVFRRHMDEDGLGATIENGWVVMYDRGMRVTLCEAAKVPISFGGKARFNLANALAATLATYATGIHPSDITSGLLSFYQSSHQTPGRLNFIDMDGFRVLMDYAHNAHGLGALCELVRQLRDNQLTLVIGLPGDRRDTDIRESVRAVAQTFDRIVIREDFDLRGRSAGEVPALIKDELLAAGFPAEKLEVFLDEAKAVEEAVLTAQPGDLIVYIADKPERGAAIVEELRTRTMRQSREISVPAPS